MYCAHTITYVAKHSESKNVGKDTSFCTYKTEDLEDDVLPLYLDDEDSVCTADEQNNNSNATSTQREKEKETLRRKNASLMRNTYHTLSIGKWSNNCWNRRQKPSENAIEFHFVCKVWIITPFFERLLFDLQFYCLYFMYDIGLDNCSALSEQHPSHLFMFLW